MTDKTWDEDGLAYAAGFLDGEGCFTVGRNWKITVTTENTYRPVVEWLHYHFGGSLTRNSTKRKPNHRPLHRWCVVSQDAYKLCLAVTPYLKEKAPQALLLIAIQQTMGKYWRVPPELADERNRLAGLVKEYKRVAWL
jgi:hypothetical protein